MLGNKTEKEVGGGAQGLVCHLLVGNKQWFLFASLSSSVLFPFLFVFGGIFPLFLAILLLSLLFLFNY